MTPEMGDSTATSQNIDSSAETSNTDSGQGSRPQSVDPSKLVARGIEIGVQRALQKLGLGDSVDEAAEKLETLRNPPEESVQENGNIAEHPDFMRVTKELGTFQRKATEQEKMISSLQAQADEARLEKLRAAALSAGVGPGRQLDAFISMYGDLVVFGEDRSLEVLGKLPDGSKAPMGQSLEDFMKESLEDSPFLLAPQQTGGVGSTMKPTRKVEPTVSGGYGQEQRDEFAAQLGVRPKPSS